MTLSDGEGGQTTCLEEVIERICNQSRHREGHKNILWDQEGGEVLHRAGGRVDLGKVYLRNRVSEAHIKGRKLNLDSPGSWRSEGPKTD